MAVLAAVEDAVRMAEHKVIPLRSSILTAAFSGKLVPQDPTDEPASILLDRIAAQRASMDGHRAARNARQERLPL
jgi:type I restriction enzyme S subunit